MSSIKLELTPETNPSHFGSILSFIQRLPKTDWGAPFLPNKMLPKDIQPAIAKVYKALFNEELPAEDYTLLFRVEDSVYKRTMCPFVSLNKDNKNLILHWGAKTVELAYAPGGKMKELKSTATPEDEIDSYMLNFDEVSFGIGTDPCLSVTLDTKEGSITMPLSLFRDKETIDKWKDFSVPAANMKLRKGGNFEGLISSFDASGNIGRLYDLEVGIDYLVVGVEVKEVTANGKPFTSGRLILEDGKTVYANKHILNTMMADPKPIIDKEHPAVLTIYGVNGKRVNCRFLPAAHQAVTDSGIDYSLLSDSELVPF